MGVLQMARLRENQPTAAATCSMCRITDQADHASTSGPSRFHVCVCVEAFCGSCHRCGWDQHFALKPSSRQSHCTPARPMAYTGTLKKFMDGKGFGFIENSDGSGDVFVHFSQLTNGGSEDMVVGAEMTFDIEEDPRSGKTKATNVTLQGGGGGGGGGGYGSSYDSGKGKGKGKGKRYDPY